MTIQWPTLVDKLWDAHTITTRADGQSLLFIDRHFLRGIVTLTDEDESGPEVFGGTLLCGRSGASLLRPNFEGFSTC
jgi:3-isopropylmalate/(R)-2-methylmalate dehydratase large subunit